MTTLPPDPRRATRQASRKAAQASHQASRKPDDENRMRPTSAASLVVGLLVSALCVWLMVRRFYGMMSLITVWVSIPLMVLTIVCAVLAWWVRRGINRGAVGQDRHQVHPLLAARAFVLGRACAWAGALFCGAGLGAGMYVWPKVSYLLAARADMPGLITFTVMGLVLSIAGVVLERCCKVPPTGIGEEETQAAGT